MMQIPINSPGNAEVSGGCRMFTCDILSIRKKDNKYSYHVFR